MLGWNVCFSFYFSLWCRFRCVVSFQARGCPPLTTPLSRFRHCRSQIYYSIFLLAEPTCQWFSRWEGLYYYLLVRRVSPCCCNFHHCQSLQTELLLTFVSVKCIYLCFSDDDRANPLVVRIQDDLESSDEDVTTREYRHKPPPSPVFSIKENVTTNISKTAKVLQLNATNESSKPNASNVASEPQKLYTAIGKSNTESSVKSFSANVTNEPSLKPYATIEPSIKSCVSSENVFTPYKENDSNKYVDSPDSKLSASNSDGSLFGKMDKLTVYDQERKVGASEEEKYDSGPEFNESNLYIPTPMWPIDTSIRRSPEGRRMDQPLNRNNMYAYKQNG